MFCKTFTKHKVRPSTLIQGAIGSKNQKDLSKCYRKAKCIYKHNFHSTAMCLIPLITVNNASASQLLKITE